MAAGLLFILVLVGFVVFMFIAIAAVIGGAIYFLFTQRSTFLPGPNQVTAIIEDWARRNDYELLSDDRVRDRDHPFADRFGFGKRPGVVRVIEVETSQGRRRRGWVYLAARSYGPGTGGLRPDSLEVGWDE